MKKVMFLLMMCITLLICYVNTSADYLKISGYSPIGGTGTTGYGGYLNHEINGSLLIVHCGSELLKPCWVVVGGEIWLNVDDPAFSEEDMIGIFAKNI
ncbi:MAG: hypothetical protein NT007_06895 [Candidatus Kapabacteria bacterium]|nr:hypothetical protein [Candidatus Kapabacteria bacterium]